MKKFRVGQVAEQLNVSPSAIRKYCRQGLLNHDTTPSGQRVFTQEHINAFLGETSDPAPTKIYYARTNATRPKEVTHQIERLTETYGEPDHVYKDYGSGLNENRKGLWSLIKQAQEEESFTIYICSQDRLTRFGVKYLEHHFSTLGGQIIVLDDANEKSLEEELMQDFMSLIASFSGKFYRLRGYRQQKQLLEAATQDILEREKNAM